MKTSLIALTSFILAILVVGCGPEKSELDLERERTKGQLLQKTAETEFLIGQYKGWAMHERNKIFPLTLFIERTYKSVQTGGAEPIMVPKFVVAGYFDSKTSTTPADFIFPDVEYFASTKTLICSTAPSLSSDAGSASMVLSFSNTNPTGTYTSPRIITLPNGKKTLTLDIVLEKLN